MTGMEDFLTQNGPLALLTAVILQGLKKWDVIGLLAIPQGEKDKWTSRKNLAVSVLAAVMVTVGIHYTWHYDAGTGAFAFGLTGTLSGLKQGLWECLQQWIAQHGAYKTVIVLPELLGKITSTNSALLSYLETHERPAAVRVEVKEEQKP